MSYLDDLRTLAQRHGVATAYEGFDHIRREVDEVTLQAVLAALGVAARTPEEVAASFAALDEAPWRSMLPPSVVAVRGREHHFAVHVPHGEPVQVWVETESGERVGARQLDVWVDPTEVDGRLVGRATFELPIHLPLGWHTLHAESAGTAAQCVVAVTPARLTRTDALTDRQRWGLALQLYSVRSHRSWGVGDFGDLADLADIVGRVHGGDYVLVNPLHAAQPVPPLEQSPYLPTTRRFVNPLYIRIADIPETAELSPSRFAKVAKVGNRAAERNTKGRRIDRDRAYRAKLKALEYVHRVPRSPRRQSAFEQYLDTEGHGLRDFALWCALTERYGPDDTRWANDFAGPDAPGVAKRRAKLADRIDFYCWLQWVCDEQLAAAQQAAIDAGMEIGVMHDLAVGVQADGADVWALGDVLVPAASVGAPPDDFNQQGQRWNQPPWHPVRLAERGYLPYRDMLRTVLRHAGGIRVDHILGLFRLWWIPAEAASPAQGAYVHYDHDALIGILALEAERAGAVVVGEDLGVFEPSVQDRLRDRGILGTSILWFEHGPYAPIPPEEYRQLCLTSVTTHDLPPTAGYLAGGHIDLRNRLGLLERDIDAERADDARNRDAIVDLARVRGLLGDVTDEENPADVETTVDALYALIARSPSVLLGVALVDAVGETRIQNQPGTDASQYPNWCIPLGGPDGRPVGVEDLATSERFTRLVAAVAGRR